jgi:hypothetical protein
MGDLGIDVRITCIKTNCKGTGYEIEVMYWI